MLLAAVLAAGCAAGPAAPFRATAGTCYAFAVQAVQRHVTVARLPRACAGLSHDQIDQALARAIRAVAGLGPKALHPQAQATPTTNTRARHAHPTSEATPSPAGQACLSGRATISRRAFTPSDRRGPPGARCARATTASTTHSTAEQCVGGGVVCCGGNRGCGRINGS